MSSCVGARQQGLDASCDVAFFLGRMCGQSPLLSIYTPISVFACLVYPRFPLSTTARRARGVWKGAIFMQRSTGLASGDWEVRLVAFAGRWRTPEYCATVSLRFACTTIHACDDELDTLCTTIHVHDDELNTVERQTSCSLPAARIGMDGPCVHLCTVAPRMEASHGTLSV